VNIDLERLIALQRLDSAAHEARQRLAREPEREKALEAGLESARQAVAATKERLAKNQNTRRTIEKDIATIQSRLSKYRDQLMEVKTNREYQAMQKEIEVAETEIKEMEETLLERMLEGDELTAAVKRVETDLAAQQKAVEGDRRAMSAESVELNASLERLGRERAELIRAIEPQALAMFELVARRRNGVAVAEARDGICSICHVRLRPQVFNTVRRNEQLIQCDTCNRILYFSPAAPAATPAGVSQSAQ
jgi:predicted  nucleic acid-binding Zn-ribbon protein